MSSRPDEQGLRSAADVPARVRLGRALPAARSSRPRIGRSGLRGGCSALDWGLAATAAVVSIAVAELAFLFERDRDDGAFDSFADALLWPLATVLALQADPVPASVGGRIAMLAGFLFGGVVVASLAGTVGAFLVDSRRERAQREDELRR